MTSTPPTMREFARTFDAAALAEIRYVAQHPGEEESEARAELRERVVTAADEWSREWHARGCP